MIRLCVLGNSHIAALKMAWEDLAPAFSDIEITFFAARGEETRDLEVHNGRLEPGNPLLRDQFVMTSGGHDRIDPERYDVFLSCGCMTVALGKGECTDYSEAFARKSLLDRARGSLMLAHVERLKAVTNKPVFAAPAPLRAQSRKGARAALMPLPIASEVLRDEIFHPLNVGLVVQPRDTLLDDYTTKREFAVGSMQLADVQKPTDAHPEGEVVHMNKDYGTAFLRDFLPRIASNSPHNQTQGT